MKLSKAQRRTLDILRRDGSVTAGREVRVATLRALAAKGLGTYTVLGGEHVLHSY